MARQPSQARDSDGPAPDPPWVDDDRETADPVPIEPPWAVEPPEPPPEPPPPIEPAWASEEAEDEDRELIDPPWAAETDVDDETLRAALEEPVPIDPPWAAVEPDEPSGPVDPPWVEDVRPDDTPPEPIEPDWAVAEPDEPDPEPLGPVDPPWLEDAESVRGPVRLRGPIDPPWVPDDVSEALDAEAAQEPTTPFEPDWANDEPSNEPPAPIEPDWIDAPRLGRPTSPLPIDPGWEESAPETPPEPIDPDWAEEAEIDETDDELFDPDWETTPRAEDQPSPDPIDPDWAAEVQNEVDQRRTDPFEAPHEDGESSVTIGEQDVRKGVGRLRQLVNYDALNPFGRAKRAAARKASERQELIDNAMRIRAESRAALGEETVDKLYEAIMGSPPPKEEDD